MYSQLKSEIREKKHADRTQRTDILEAVEPQMEAIISMMSKMQRGATILQKEMQDLRKNFEKQKDHIFGSQSANGSSNTLDGGGYLTQGGFKKTFLQVCDSKNVCRRRTFTDLEEQRCNKHCMNTRRCNA